MSAFLCVSANPAIDKRVRLAGPFVAGKVNRAGNVERFAGGKATHVAMVLRTLGELPRWIGPCGGATGEELKAGLAALGISAEAVDVAGATRTNEEVIDSAGQVTELLEPGAALSDAELEKFVKACHAIFSTGGARLTAIFSGSLPQNAPHDLFGRLVELAKKHGCTTMVDTSGKALRAAIAARPDFVKPNRDEMEALLGRTVGPNAEGCAAVRELLARGSQSAALSLGADGLMYCGGADEAIYLAEAVPVKAASTVGCGDASVAGFALARATKKSVEDMLRLATACAAANCLADSPGAARREDIERFLRDVRVRRLDG